MNTTSKCDVTNSAHQTQMTTMCHWMKPSPWKYSVYATDGKICSDFTVKVKEVYSMRFVSKISCELCFLVSLQRKLVLRKARCKHALKNVKDKTGGFRSTCISEIVWKERISSVQKLALLLLRPEIPSGKCAKLHTVAAGNNRDNATRSFYRCLFATYIWVLFLAHIPFVVHRALHTAPTEWLQYFFYHIFTMSLFTTCSLHHEFKMAVVLFRPWVLQLGAWKVRKEGQSMTATYY